MINLMEILIFSVSTIFDHANQFLTSVSDAFFLPEYGNGVVFAFAFGTVSEGTLVCIRRWHGSINGKFANIDNIVSLVVEHQQQWMMPDDLLTQLMDNHSQLQTLINRCRTTAASTADRNLRNSLLKSTVSLCLLQVKIWAYGRFMAGVLTADDVHLLGFLLPGESGGHHERTDATDVIAEVKVKVINEDFIRVVIDRSAGENAAKVSHGWPEAVHSAVIVVTAADGKTEILRHMTTRLHNDIRMPDGSHGKQFIIKASFLRHVDDEPRFGSEQTFSMPLTTQDIAAALSQHREDMEAQMRELELQRKEIEYLRAELNGKK
jgi:hypothetical protein